MGTSIFHDCFNMFVKERDNGLFSRGASSCYLDFSSFVDWFVKYCVVDLNDFLVGEGLLYF